MKYKAVIFDLDGTIVDTENIWKNATLSLIARKGFVLDTASKDELQQKLQGLAIHKSCSIIKNLIKSDESVEDLMSEKLKIANDLYKDGVKFIPGFLDFYTRIAKTALKYGIATNADDLTLRTTDEALHLRKFFGEHLYNISCVGNLCKPNPAIYLFVAGKLAVDPRDCIVIEDSAHGIAAAKDAGMTCIGINTAKDERQLVRADYIIQSYDEIDLATW